MDRQYAVKREVVLGVIEHIETNIRRVIPVVEVTKRSGYAHRYFQKMFIEHVGMSIGAYVRRRRIAEAIRYLQDTAGKESMLDISTRFGYESSQNFARAIRAEVGITPSAVKSGSPIKAGLLLERF